MEIEEYDFADDLNDFIIVDFIENRIVRRIYERAHMYEDLEDSDFFKRFRLTKPSVYDLLVMIEERLEFPYDKNNSISPINRLLICLRVYATGGHLLSMADFGGMHVSTVSRIVVQVSNVIASLRPLYVKFPADPDAIKQTQNEFYNIAKFPRVIGVLDCTHIKIQSPGGEDAEIFRNRKNYFSLNVQAVANARLEITNIVARWPGSSHDSTIFTHCNLRRNFERGLYPNCLLLGDSAYAIKTYLFTPLQNPRNEAEQLYNESHIRTRTKIENVFGVWKRRFPILAYGCRLKMETTMTIIVACAVLHNIARKRNELEPPIDDNINEHELQRLIDLGQIPNIPNALNQPNGAGFLMRRNLIDFFANL